MHLQIATTNNWLYIGLGRDGCLPIHIAMAGENVSPDHAQVFQFSTDAFRENERVSAWREAFGRTLLNIDIAPKSPEDFRASATIYHSRD